MSYCRFSDCDVYLFTDGEAWHVMTKDQKVMAQYPTREECRAALLGLREKGYDVSQCAIDRLDMEIAHGKQIWDIPRGENR